MSTTDEQRLREALADAAKSLRSVERLSGRGEHMQSFVDVRAYACGRAWAAEQALAQQAPTPAAVSEPAAPFGDERFAHVRNKFGKKLTPLGDRAARQDEQKGKS